SAQKDAAPQAEPSRTGSKKMAGVDLVELRVALRIECQHRDDTDTETQFDISLDDIRIERGENHVGLESLGVECGVDFRAAGKRGVVGDDRILYQCFERQRLNFGQRMSLRHQYAPVPRVARQ